VELAVTALILILGIVAGWLSAQLVHTYAEEPETETAVRCDARCPHCSHVLTLGDTAPPRWWIKNRLSCPHCAHSLPLTWFATQLAVPALCLAMLGTWGSTYVLIPFLWLVPVLVVAAMVDIRLMLIPRRVAWIGFGVGAALITAVSVGTGSPDLLRGAFLGAVGYFGLLFIVSMISPGGMGFGDVRLSLLLGLYLGWTSILLPAVGLIIACVLGVILGVGVRIATKGAQRHFPFGPGLALGTILAIYFHTAIINQLIPPV